MSKCGCKGKEFKETDKTYLCFQDYENGESVPAPGKALSEISSCKCLPDLFSNVKAYLLSALTGLDVVNDLVSGGIDVPLSAEMGKELNSKLKPEIIDPHTIIDFESDVSMQEVFCYKLSNVYYFKCFMSDSSDGSTSRRVGVIKEGYRPSTSTRAPAQAQNIQGAPYPAYSVIHAPQGIINVRAGTGHDYIGINMHWVVS